MTLTSELVKVQYNGNGSTTAFEITYIYWGDTDIKVVHRDALDVETTWVDGTHYTLTGGLGETGTLNVSTSPTDYTPASGETLTIKSNRSDTQDDALPLGGKFPSSVVEQALDQQARLIQQKEEELSRAIKLSETSAISNVTIENPVTGQYLRWAGDGTIDSAVLPDTFTAQSIDETDTDTVKDKMVSNNLGFIWEAVRTAWDLHTTFLASGTPGQRLNSNSGETNGVEWGNQIPTLAKATTYTVAAADQGKLLLLSGASFTVTLPAASTVGAGFTIGFKYTGTNQTYTIDGNASETIDNVANTTLDYVNEVLWLVSDGSNWHITQRTGVVEEGLLNGLTLSNGTDATNDIDIATGIAASQNDVKALIELKTIMVKQIDAAWVAGSAAGGFPSGLTLTNDTWYHVFLIKRSDTGVVDAGYDTSATAANLLSDASNYDSYRRIGSVYYGTATIDPFLSHNGRVFWEAWASSTDPATGNLVVRTPPDVRCIAHMMQVVNTPNFTQGSSTLRPNVGSSTVQTAGGFQGTGTASGDTGRFDAPVDVLTDTSSQIHNIDGSGNTIYIYTMGYTDFRGKS